MNMLDGHQMDTVKAQAELLLRKLEHVSDYPQLKAAVLAFVTAMDTKAYVLGDTELVALGAASVRRRGKDVTLGAYLFQRAWVLEEEEYDTAAKKS
jgi:pyruvate/2-oxoglutarate/acetoin dehydrogenase E1 component